MCHYQHQDIFETISLGCCAGELQTEDQKQKDVLLLAPKRLNFIMVTQPDTWLLLTNTANHPCSAVLSKHG
jgi:hypothetical protein